MISESGQKTAGSPWEAFSAVWEILLVIAVPAILFALAGNWLDGRFKRSPLFSILGFLLAFVISAGLVYRKAKQLRARFYQSKKDE